ncbi:DUF922 domain-containing protein [Mesorhizobium sp. KR1-2]|uniref:DUF922 domain-containing protein n=1 Tax=Mesorhizobium sp. KR1-2 TaxID=3156609 RepID=UPI0032B32E02
MRSIAISVLVLACGVANVAHAGGKVLVKTETYPVSGTTSNAIMQSMNRGGPREGLQARAMAATRYDVHWNMNWDKSGGACHLRSATPTLSLTYRFPKLASRVSPDLKQRWDRFMVGVRTHEQVHGKIAQDMANAAQSALTGISNNNDPNCTKSQAEVQRRVKGVYSEYEGRQRGFDAKEHRPGGNVERLVGDFMRG